IAENEIPVKIFLMNNGFLGMVRQWQELFWDGRYSHVDTGNHPDWLKLADAYGIWARQETDKSNLVNTFKEAIAHEGPAFVDVRVTKEENTYPMIPAGEPARNMVG
ncbi:MAG: thiamine pyrophosphate-dependent enzyme, partial [Solirubrobacterales bacterium]